MVYFLVSAAIAIFLIIVGYLRLKYVDKLFNDVFWLWRPLEENEEDLGFDHEIRLAENFASLKQIDETLKFASFLSVSGVLLLMLTVISTLLFLMGVFEMTGDNPWVFLVVIGSALSMVGLSYPISKFVKKVSSEKCERGTDVFVKVFLTFGFRGLSDLLFGVGVYILFGFGITIIMVAFFLEPQWMMGVW